MRKLVVLPTIALLLVSGCGFAGPHADVPRVDAKRPRSVLTATRVDLGATATLVAGADGRLPVSVRWIADTDAPEQVAVHDGVVYVADEVLYAFRLSDGRALWNVGAPDAEALEADGGVEIGLDGPDRIRAWAPFNYDIVAARDSGDLVSLHRGVGGDLPRGMTPIAAPMPSRFRVNTDYPDRVVARWPGGSIAWQIRVTRPYVDSLPPIAVPGGMVLALSTGKVVALDYR